jgi:hypothetical protein
MIILTETFEGSKAEAHWRVEFNYPHKHSEKTSRPKVATAFVYLNDSLISYGAATYTTDKVFGRTLAFSEAISVYDRGFRTKLWTEYWKMSNKPQFINV